MTLLFFSSYNGYPHCYLFDMTLFFSSSSYNGNTLHTIWTNKYSHAITYIHGLKFVSACALGWNSWACVHLKLGTFLLWKYHYLCVHCLFLQVIFFSFHCFYVVSMSLNRYLYTFFFISSRIYLYRISVSVYTYICLYIYLFIYLFLQRSIN